MVKNAFDELLESMAENHRKALTEVAEANPELKNGFLRQSDYSRRMDEVKREKEQYQDRLKFADSYEAWWKENYVPNALGDGKGATKRELAKIQEAEDLRKQYEELQKQATVGGDVTYEDLNGYMDKLITERGIARQDDLSAIRKAMDEKASGVEAYVNQNMMGNLHVATKLPTLAIKHYQKYGEALDGDKLVEFASKGYTDLVKAYDDFTAPQRQEMDNKGVEAAKEAARKEGYEAALKERGMNPDSMPVDNKPPQMGHFQAKILGIKTSEDGSVSVSDSAELGSGALATAAARNWDRDKG